jgi:hypothetical protein
MGYIIALKKTVKAALAKRGIKDPGIELSEEFGDKLRKGLRELAASKDPVVKTLGERALAMARTQIGVKEQPPGSNSGPQVTVYQKTTGAYREPWCASFAKWSYKAVGATPAQLSRATADVTTWLAYAHVSLGVVRAGDLVIYNWDGGDVDHIGLFDHWATKGSELVACEGNTSESGSQSNGGEVMLRTRAVNLVAAFVRIPT